MGEKRKVIGVLVAGIADNFTVHTCRGVIREVKNRDIDIVIMPGKYIYRDLSNSREIRYEYQYNTLFKYALNKRVDAVIVIAGSICCYTSMENTLKFLSEYSDIPCVLIGCKADGYLSVNYDNYQGIKEGLEYLIKNLNCKKIAMMGGPDSNTDAFERKQTFFKVLEDNGIPTDDENYYVGDLTKSQREGFGAYLDRHPDVEAICCVNDDTALSLYKAMNDKGLVPGQDIYVMGYDNDIQGARAKPALTTVMADAVPLGGKALELILDALDGKPVESVIVPTKAIIRESFGYDRAHKKSIQEKRLDRDYIEFYYNEIFYRNNDDVNEGRLFLLFKTIMELVIDYYEEGFDRNLDNGTLIRLINTFMHMGAINYADVENLLTHVEEICQLVLEKYGINSLDKNLFSEISSVYREIVMAEEQLHGDLMESNEKKDYDLKTFVTASMQFENGSDQNYGVFLEYLKWLDINNADLYMFAKPIMHLENDDFKVPNHVYLKAALRDGELQNIGSVKKRIRSSEIFRSNILGDMNNIQIIFPIFSNEIMYGLIKCDMSDQIYYNGEFFVGQLGSAAKMLNLLKTNESIQNEYEQSLVTLKNNNIALDALAKSDGLTGILNRRGFNERAQVLLKNNKETGKRTLVAYIDMNNLKIINDRYGHDEGDFSIQLISDTITKCYPDGIVGRIGGDEFALISDYEGKDDGESVVAYIYKAFKDFNESSDKPYNVTVSAGVYCVDSLDSIELQEALALADEKLYIEKQHRVKSVAKE